MGGGCMPSGSRLHPGTLEQMTIVAPLPGDIRELLSILRNH